MAKYKISWTQEQWFHVEIEASDEDVALAKFWDGDYENEQMFGSEIQERVDVEEIEE
jgi:hypothetical protein